MGLFHCPIGAENFGDEICIRCGLCAATTRAEKLAATENMRKWIRENAHLRNPDLKIHKIALCGKGGAGKSTATALLSGALEHIGYQSMILDTDSSNGGLWRKLGMQSPPRTLSEAAESAIPNFFVKDPLYFEEVEEPYVCQNRMRRLICAGKIEDPLLGCACTIGTFARALIQNLSPQAREIVLADQEAGVESFGRGIEQSCDTVLILVEPSSEAIELAAKIQYMAQGIGIRRIRAVLSKVEDEEQEEFMQEALSAQGIRFLGTIPQHRELRRLNLLGGELTPELSYRLAGRLVTAMLDEAEMTYDRVK